MASRIGLTRLEKNPPLKSKSSSFAGSIPKFSMLRFPFLSTTNTALSLILNDVLFQI